MSILNRIFDTKTDEISEKKQALSSDDSGRALIQPREKIGEKELNRAQRALEEYKRGKENLEARIKEDEDWYRLRHWEVIRRKRGQKIDGRPEPSSAWLFNAIMNKHADALDNYPTPNVLPREKGDEKDAKILSEIIPVIIERAQFEDTYSTNWWDKLKHGTAAYGVFWNSELENGLGDIDIRAVDLLNIFWEPGINDIQKSRYLFIVDLVDTDILEENYPKLKGKLRDNKIIDVVKYNTDDEVDTSNKSLVVDCYYKVRQPSGRTVLHLLKFCGNEILFASENEEEYQKDGFYAHGKYPVVFDVLFPEKSTPAGFGYVSLCKSPQLYIDALGQNIIDKSMMSSKPRFFASKNLGINKKQLLDWNEPIIEVEGNGVDDTRLREFTITPLSSSVLAVYNMKVDELKETAANRDINSGGTASGVTAAAAIAALQEAGNKNSRDMISAAYRSYTEIIYLVIELIRQFYDEKRSFRITGINNEGEYHFEEYDNRGLKDQVLPPDYEGQEKEKGYVPNVRRPIFDIKIRAEKKNPFSQMAENERAKECYQLGMFNPEMADQALAALEMMDFEGIDQVRERIKQGQTLQNTVQSLSQQLEKAMAIISVLTGHHSMPDGDIKAEDQPMPNGYGSSNNIDAAAKNAIAENMTPYGDALAKRSTPNMSTVESGATVS